ncbi:MAG: hypothetical protein NW241_13375 [Bacteroidia bacterium]|nr:hypothetical protein [Bacteroidia bacterium]
MGMSLIKIHVNALPELEVIHTKLSAHTGLEITLDVFNKGKPGEWCIIGTPDGMSFFELQYVNDNTIEMASTGLHSYLCIAALQVLIDLGVTTADNIPIKIPKWSRQRWADRKWWQFIKL